MVLQGERLFADWSTDEGIVFTLTDEHGDIIGHGTLSISLKTFECAMIKPGGSCTT
jgi:hypothetical protein